MFVELVIGRIKKREFRGSGSRKQLGTGGAENLQNFKVSKFHNDFNVSPDRHQ